jgi:Fic-DOC domain mobile mystery protein B
MTDPLVPVGDGHTDLSDDDTEGLLLSYIGTRAELNAAEQQNIFDATMTRRAPSVDALLDEDYLRALHKAMFGRVWQWAGQYRKRETNIGVAPAQIAGEIRSLINDVQTWIDHESYGADELCVRFHHRQVAIHPFPNGNGRHGRIAADYLIRALGQPAFTWGIGLDLPTPKLRARYLHALQRADAHNISTLITFARS